MGMMTFLLVMKTMMIRKYHSHKTLRETLLKLESDFPDIAEVDNSKRGKVINVSPGLLHRDKCSG